MEDEEQRRHLTLCQIGEEDISRFFIICNQLPKTRGARIGNIQLRNLFLQYRMATNFRTRMQLTWEVTTQKNLVSLRPRLNRRPFADDIFKCIFLNENEWILPSISLKFVPKVRINNIPALVQIMVWRLPGDKPLSEQMMVSLLTHICVTRPQWVSSEDGNVCPGPCYHIR